MVYKREIFCYKPLSHSVILVNQVTDKIGTFGNYKYPVPSGNCSNRVSAAALIKMAAPMRFNALTSNSQLFACLMFVLISVKCDNEHADIPKDPNSEDGPLQDSFYSFDARTADGELVELSKYKGMVREKFNL